MKNFSDVRNLLLVVLLLFTNVVGSVSANGSKIIIRNGILWFDTDGKIVNAHGACIVRDNHSYYLFGEYKSDERNAFSGFSCYLSPDLVNWQFECIALDV